ncbi:MAG: hypothetical protein SV375_20685 [Thermodesulfobacteriota bacterium]|nr:hypothetical protein [Thermodesulfobacteriota bacterium]
MKRLSLTTAFIILLITLVSANVLGQGNKKDSSEIKWVDIKKVCIEYEVTGTGKGKKKVYIGDWGNEHLTILDVVMEMGSMKQRTHTATYLKGNKIYTVDLMTNKGTVAENPMRSAYGEKQAKQAGEKFLKKYGKEVGTENFLGKKCRVFEMPDLGTRTLVWKNITLKSVTSMGPMKQIMTAVKIILDFDEKIFNLPTNINFNESPNFEDIMRKMKGH